MAMAVSSIECKFISEECIREWKNPGGGFKFPHPIPMLRFIYELCWTIIRGDLPLQRCSAALDSVEFSEKGSREEMASMFSDIVAQMAQDLTMPGDYRARLIKMAKWLVESSLVPLRLFHERCEEEFLWESEMIKIKSQDLKAKEVRVNTRLLYQQTKFNLLREESEGYAKLVTLLCQNCSDDSTHSASEAMISTIKSLIGHFDLDPNRVFDIVLDCFELQPYNNIFFDLIPIFPKSHASQVLGFKFQYYQRMEVSSSVPFGLYRLTAFLIKADCIDLESICAHLLPKDEVAFEHYEAYSTKRVDEANKIGKINLAATGKDLMDDEKQGDVTVDLYTALDMENDAVSERYPEFETHQSLGLLHGFLSVDDWYHASILLDRLSPLNPVAHIEICEGLFRLTEKSISSLYEDVRQSHFVLSNAEATSIDSDTSQNLLIEIPKELFQMLGFIGPYLHRNAVLLQKVCRVLKYCYKLTLELVTSHSGSNLADHGSAGGFNHRFQLKEMRIRVEEALGSCILPSLQLIPANPAIGQEIWELMSLLPYEVRYRLYGEWEKDDEKNPMVLAARQTAKLDTRRILKRLAKENLKQLGRMVAKLAHANPMIVLRTIVHQIEAYRDMIAPVVDAFKYLTQLEYDILEYVVIERLAQSGREKLKDDGLNLSDWLQSLASFWGHLCKKYPSMELRGLFQYLVNQLKKGKGIELILLQELIQQMANVQYTENMTEDQLDAMAGSETLRYQATLFGITRNNKALIKSTNRLRDSLLPKDEPKLAIPLLLLIAQHRSLVVVNADAPYIKMVSEQFDRCHGTLLQYVEFLSSAITPISNYAQLIPSLHDLIHKYHLEAEVAFLIYRPVMRLFKCTSASEVFWPSCGGEDENSTKEQAYEASNLLSELILDVGKQQKLTSWSDLLDTVRTTLPTKAWNSLSPDLYATFWGLTLYDLYVPRNRYESEISKQNVALKALEELSDNSSSAIMKRKKEKERIQEILDRLTNEFKKHEENVVSVRKRLAREKDKWLSSCPDTLKINMEFLQRCIFPRCIFSMPDAVYCAMFVHTLHSLGTPFFNTVNHIDVLICKTLHPMICCCTEYEAGRLGRFLYETLKMAYHWKSDESIYERECGNMPGFAVYYRFPNSQRVTFGQFIRVHWKWSQRITRLLIQCLESSEYMEIRNALIMLTKISSVFPVTRKSGINLEKRVAKIKGDEREDLKVLATSVSAALAARKSSWVSEEEFGMGYIDVKPPTVPAKVLGSIQNGSSVSISQNDCLGSRNANIGGHPSDSHFGKVEHSEIIPSLKHDSGQVKQKVGSREPHPSTSSTVAPGASRQAGIITKSINETGKSDENLVKVPAKSPTEFEAKTHIKRSAQAGNLTKQNKAELLKDDLKTGKSMIKNIGHTPSTGEKELLAHPSDKGQSGVSELFVSASNGIIAATSKVSTSKSSTDIHVSKVGDKQQKRASPVEDPDRMHKRRRGDMEGKDGDVLDAPPSDRERGFETRLVEKHHTIEPDKNASEDQSLGRLTDKLKDKVSEKYEREHRERLERQEKSRGDDNISEKDRDKSMERHGGERSIERVQERVMEKGFERTVDKGKDDRNKQRYNETSNEKSHGDDRFRGQSLPPPPPLPPNVVPQSITVSRRDEDVERRVSGTTTRHPPKMSPRHEDKERRRSEENLLISQDATKRRKDDESRDRRRDDRDGLSKADDRDKDKEELDLAAASKRRKLKRDHLSSSDVGVDCQPIIPTQSPVLMNMSQPYDGRDKSDRKNLMVQRGAYLEEPVPRMHSKDTLVKMSRRESDQLYDRDWEEEKRQRADQKRRHPHRK